MRRRARTLWPVAILALSLSVSALGQTRTVPKVRDHHKLMLILEYSLKSDIPGIVESTIYDMIQYKSYYPKQNFSRLISDLNDLSASCRDSAISYKAHLASMYLSYGSSLDNGSAFDPSDHERAFQLASDQLSRKFLFTHATE